jgi:hypothetical protein
MADGTETEVTLSLLATVSGRKYLIPVKIGAGLSLSVSGGEVLITANPSSGGGVIPIFVRQEYTFSAETPVLPIPAGATSVEFYLNGLLQSVTAGDYVFAANGDIQFTGSKPGAGEAGVLKYQMPPATP